MLHLWSTGVRKSLWPQMEGGCQYVKALIVIASTPGTGETLHIPA